MEYQFISNNNHVFNFSNSAPLRPAHPYRQARQNPTPLSTSTPVDVTFLGYPTGLSNDSTTLSLAYRRGISLPPELVDHTTPNSVFARSGRRRSICFRQRVTVEEVEEKIFDARLLLSDIDAAMRKLEEKRIIMEEILDRAQQQLEDHAVYFDGRYPSAPDRLVDVTENKCRAEEQWHELRLVNAPVRSLKDDITPLPYADGRMPKHFPNRLAGLMNLSERQVDGLLSGYGQSPNEEALDYPIASFRLDSKRRLLALFIGVDIQAVVPIRADLPARTHFRAARLT